MTKSPPYAPPQQIRFLEFFHHPETLRPVQMALRRVWSHRWSLLHLLQSLSFLFFLTSGCAEEPSNFWSRALPILTTRFSETGISLSSTSSKVKALGRRLKRALQLWHSPAWLRTASVCTLDALPSAYASSSPRISAHASRFSNCWSWTSFFSQFDFSRHFLHSARCWS